ncbi:putative T7SS-secreted protein [Streptomyces sp. NPDC048258]|uniref:putative T7SS-secreted protein n=1 Tax=Streptomyces sp. NPDC048258 TaxID=3365527 RepID=UPI00371EF48B
MTDFGSLLGKGIDALGDGVDSAKKAIGHGVDMATEGIGAGLDYVGAHDWADKVEDFGDDVAHGLGAMPEKRLGQTQQANELLHGKPDAIWESAAHLKDFQAAFDRVGQGMKALDSGHWKGAAADAFRGKFAMHPTDWFHAADACEAAGNALSGYAETVMWAQLQAQSAIELYRQGKKASKDAADAYKTRAEAYEEAVKAGQDPGPCPAPGADPGEAACTRAREILDEARRQRDDAARAVDRAIAAATEHAPAEPSTARQIMAEFMDYEGSQAVELTHVLGGAVKGTADILNFARGLNPNDPYNLTHPAEYQQHLNMTLAGLVSTAAHPERVPAGLIESLKGDFSEGVGRLFPEFVGPKGMGGARAGEKLAARETLPGRTSTTFDGLASRGSGAHIPPPEEVRRAVMESKPEILTRSWPDDDGRYYATRVLKGGRTDGETVLAGHGYIEREAGEIVVPKGTTISFYVPHGDRIPGMSGVAVEGGTYPGGAVETFREGDRIPNYTLAPPEATGVNGFSVYENSTTVSRRTMLSELLGENMGNVHWAACREFK